MISQSRLETGSVLWMFMWAVVEAAVDVTGDSVGETERGGRLKARLLDHVS